MLTKGPSNWETIDAVPSRIFLADWDVKGLEEPTVRGVFKAFCKLFPSADEIEGRTIPLKGRPPIVRGLKTYSKLTYVNNKIDKIYFTFGY